MARRSCSAVQMGPAGPEPVQRWCATFFEAEEDTTNNKEFKSFGSGRCLRTMTVSTFKRIFECNAQRAVGPCRCAFLIRYVTRLGTTLLLYIATALVSTRVPGHRCFIRRTSISLSIFSFFTGDDWRHLIPLMEIRSSFTGRRGVCLPFSDSCEPLIFEPDIIGVGSRSAP